MCVSLINYAMPAVEAGGNLQAGAQVFNALGDLAMGRARMKMAAADAAGVRVAGETAAKRIRRAAGKETGASRAGAVASGVKVTSGSVLEADRDIQRYSEQDALSAILSGENQAAGINASGRNYMRAGINSAADSLVDAATTWKRTRRPDWSAGQWGSAGPGE